MVLAVLFILVERGAAGLARRRSTSGTTTAACRSRRGRTALASAPASRPRRAASASAHASGRSMRRGVRALEALGRAAERRFLAVSSAATMNGCMKRNPTRAVRVGSVASARATPSPSRACAPRAPRTSTPRSSRPRRSARRAATLVRVAVDSPKDVEALAEIRRQTTANLVVDLQENYRLAASVAPARRQGPLQPRPPLAPREAEAGAREGALPGGRRARARLRASASASTAAASTPR